jgi:hypothetical protein
MDASLPVDLVLTGSPAQGGQDLIPTLCELSFQFRGPLPYARSRAGGKHRGEQLLVLLETAARRKPRLSRHRGSWHWPFHRRKSEMTIESDRPDQVGAQRGENQ